MLGRALAWVAGLGLLGWLLSHVPLHEVGHALARPAPWVWACTLAGVALSYLMRAARLQTVLGLASGQGRQVAGLRLDALRVILMHNAAVNLLPMRAGELSFPWLAARQLDMPPTRAVACLLWMRLQDLAVLLALGLLCWPALAWPIRAGGLAMLALAWFLGIQALNAIHKTLTIHQDRPTASGWKGLILRLHTALMEPAHHRWGAWAFTWANWTIKLGAGALLLSAITDTALATGWAGALGGELAAVVPLQGPAGFGTYEAGVWAGSALALPAGAPALAQAVTAGLALHVCLLLCAVAAGAVAWATPSWTTTRLPD